MTCVITNLDSGNSTSEADTASVNPPAGCVLLLSVAMASSVTDSTFTIAPSGAATTWTSVGEINYAGRRRLVLYKGTGAMSSGAISMNFSNFTYAEHAWSVDQVTNQDDPPNDAAVTVEEGSTSASSIVCPDVGTPGTEDAIFACFAGEESGSNVIVDSPLVELSREIGLNDVRSFTTGWDEGALTDETPSCTVTSSRGGGVACIINGLADAGGSVPIFMHHIRQQE